MRVEIAGNQNASQANTATDGINCHSEKPRLFFIFQSAMLAEIIHSEKRNPTVGGQQGFHRGKRGAASLESLIQ